MAEVLECAGERSLQSRLTELMLAVLAPAGPGLVAVLLHRRDDSFVWVVLRARLAEPKEIGQWSRRMGAQ
ncbi:hypothetical protein ACQP00_51445 [Dactylosporangium sp. CS-047395]|uniref:hypothetical protein n=1 Tax=Dactylosporangium sp. CS-047395 TaxID=3239936 RepID=UPI003D93C68F